MMTKPKSAVIRIDHPFCVTALKTAWRSEGTLSHTGCREAACAPGRWERGGLITGWIPWTHSEVLGFIDHVEQVEREEERRGEEAEHRRAEGGREESQLAVLEQVHAADEDKPDAVVDARARTCAHLAVAHAGDHSPLEPQPQWAPVQRMQREAGDHREQLDQTKDVEQDPFCVDEPRGPMLDGDRVQVSDEHVDRQREHEHRVEHERLVALQYAPDG